jgi:Raf kinase inhibitor-like YbhB/YbcL family protein
MRALELSVGIVIALALVGCSKDEASPPTTTSAPTSTATKLALTSSAFTDQGVIPRVYTCDGANQSPPLAWNGAPAGTAELTLTVEDPDAPNGTFVHWVLYRVDPGLASLGAGPVAEGTNGENSFGKRAYGGPCPPKGSQHRYIFTLSALRRATNLPDGATASQLRGAMPSDSVMGQARLVGIYGR